jgi:hypothetical protein
LATPVERVKSVIEKCGDGLKNVVPYHRYGTCLTGPDPSTTSIKTTGLESLDPQEIKV